MKKDLFSLLKKVARSFYLTIRFLPAPLQEPVALAYLLARASDTIADEGNFSPQEREMFLLALRARIDACGVRLLISEFDEIKFANLKPDPHLNDKERVQAELLQALPHLLKRLEDPRRDAVEADAIRVVWLKILEGQLLDVRCVVKFVNLKPDPHRKAFTAQDLDHYLYLVAGCVGEFWTRLSAHHFEKFSKESLDQMMTWGVSYGKGLQLLNILRDEAADQRAGRFYFDHSKRDELVSQIQSYLQEGKLYVEALKNRRLRYASALPLLLAKETVALMIKNPHLSHVKMSRWRVFLALFRNLGSGITVEKI